MKVVTETIDFEACVLSGEDFDRIVDALTEQRNALVELMTEFHAHLGGLHLNSVNAFEQLANFAAATTTISDTINHPHGRVGGAS